VRKIVFPFLIICTLAACKSKTKAPVKDSTINNSSEINQTDELIKKFKPIIQGVWVKADYVEKVIKTKSPLAAADLATWITTFYVNTDQITGDSIKFIAGYGNDDSGDVTIKFQPGKTAGTILFNGQDLSYSIENGDTTLLLPQYDEHKKQYFKTKFIRILKKQPDNNLGYGLYNYISKALVAGNYILIESGQVKSKVFFSEDRKVNGFFNCKSYDINIDLNSDANDNLDEIIFVSYSKHQLSYSFKIDADTLNLYDTYENADSTKLILGKLKYKLVRQK
jgi:hypothetical protein